MTIRKAAQLLLTVAALSAISNWAAAQQPVNIDVNLELGPKHITSMHAQKFADKVRAKVGDRIKFTMYYGGAKYTGSAAPTALGQGALDMAIPGQWHLAKFVPEMDILTLPLFHGLSQETIYKVMDEHVTPVINAKLESRLNVKVLGRHVDNAFGVTFLSNRHVKTHDDLKGLRIRIAGGTAPLEIFKTFGANALKMDWADVPSALQKGLIDGAYSSYAAVSAGKVWDAGVKYAFENNQGLLQFVPVMSKRAWNRLSPDLQKIVLQAWDEYADEGRKFAYDNMVASRTAALEAGVIAVVASKEESTRARQKLLTIQPKLVEAAGMDKAFVAKVQAIVDQMVSR